MRENLLEECICEASRPVSEPWRRCLTRILGKPPQQVWGVCFWKQESGFCSSSRFLRAASCKPLSMENSPPYSLFLFFLPLTSNEPCRNPSKICRGWTCHPAKFGNSPKSSNARKNGFRLPQKQLQKITDPMNKCIQIQLREENCRRLEQTQKRN